MHRRRGHILFLSSPRVTRDLYRCGDDMQGGDFYKVWWRQWSNPLTQYQIAHATTNGHVSDDNNAVAKLRSTLDGWRLSIVDDVLYRTSSPSPPSFVDDDNNTSIDASVTTWNRWRRRAHERRLRWQLKLVNIWCVERAQCLLRKAWCPSAVVVVATEPSTIQCARRWAHLLGLPLLQRYYASEEEESRSQLEYDCLNASALSRDDVNNKNNISLAQNLDDALNLVRHSIAFRMLEYLCGGAKGLDVVTGVHILRQSSWVQQQQDIATGLASLTLLVVVPRTIAFRLARRHRTTKTLYRLSLNGTQATLVILSNFYFSNRV